jgi:hypothetical protein
MRVFLNNTSRVNSEYDENTNHFPRSARALVAIARNIMVGFRQAYNFHIVDTVS